MFIFVLCVSYVYIYIAKEKKIQMRLTDPQLVTLPRSHRFSDDASIGSIGNNGGACVNVFVQQHECNEFCLELKLPEFPTFNELFSGLVVLIHPSCLELRKKTVFTATLESMGCMVTTSYVKAHAVIVPDDFNKDDLKTVDGDDDAIIKLGIKHLVVMSFFDNSHTAGVPMYRTSECHFDGSQSFMSLLDTVYFKNVTLLLQ